MPAKAANTGQLSALKKIRGARTMDRRALVIQFREHENPTDLVKEIVACQAEIDAIDRAIADEKRLKRSKDVL
jgi:hypothetical protein